MEIKNRVWKIADFVNELLNKYNEKHNTNETIHVNTVDKWFKELEEGHYHFLQRVSDKKVYDDLDLDIALMIMEKRNEKWNLDVIYKFITTQFDVRLPSGEDFESQAITSERQLELLLQHKFDEAIETMQKRFDDEFELKMRKLLPPVPSEEEIKTKNDKVILAAAQLQMQLKQDAINEWNMLPEKERFTKGGLFRKPQEDYIKREAFIDNYVTKEMGRLENALNIDTNKK